MKIDIENKKILITGSSGGIGLALCEKFVKLGANVIFTSSNEKNLIKLKNLYGKNHFYYVLDFLKKDSLISKIIVRANDREDTRIRLLRALDEVQISGIDTNIETHRNLINDEKFISGNFDINYLEEKFKLK